MSGQLACMNGALGDNINHFCDKFRDISRLLRANYQLLRSLGALPKSRVPFVVEHKPNAPLLTTARLQSWLLFRER
jgi:hypothetical protein